jgi:hypothetical protein
LFFLALLSGNLCHPFGYQQGNITNYIEALNTSFSGARSIVEIYSHIGLSNSGSFNISPEATRNLFLFEDQKVTLVLMQVEKH